MQRSVPNRILMIALAVAACGVLLGASGCAFWRLGKSAELVERSEPFQARPDTVALRLLVVGDSTAVGTGASADSHSLPGLAAAAFPKLLVENRAADGARYAQVLEQLQTSDARFDVVLIMAGGNDVIRLTDTDTLRVEIEQAVARARTLAPTVILMPSGNIGNAPLFFAPLSWWMTERSRMLHGLVRTAATPPDVVYVDLYKSAEDDPFVKHPELNAADGLHPSDGGYRQWWGELQQQAGLAARWAAAR